MKPKISVVVPTYNRANLLVKCLESLIDQDYPKNNYEIIVADDGSTDDTKTIIENLIKVTKSPKINYFKQANSGPASVRNLGIKQSQGDIIALTDSDCEANEDWLKNITESFTHNPSIIGVGGLTYTNPEKVTPFTHQIDNKEPWSRPTCNVAYLKSTLEEVGGFDPRFLFTNDDADISWRIESLGQVIHNPKMRILHPPRPVTFKKELNSVRYLNSEFLLNKKIPLEYKKRRVNPYREILYVHGIKIGLKRIVNQSNWLVRNPYIYIKFVWLILLQRLYLLLLLPGFIVYKKQLDKVK